MPARLLFCALLIFLVMVKSSNTADARVWQDGVPRAVSDGTNVVRYRYYLPENYDPSVKYPLVTFLHGAGERGTDNIDQVRSHIGPLIDKTFSEYPAILIAPQTPRNTGWSTTSTRELFETIMLNTMDDFSVDTSRLYLTGLSMGGFGTTDYLDYFTNVEPGLFQFAAASPLSAGIFFLSDLSQQDPWKDTPIWIMHGSNDNTVDQIYSRMAYASFVGLESTQLIRASTTSFPDLGRNPTAIDDNVRFTLLPGRGHNIWGDIYRQNEFYDWMFAQSLVPEPTGLTLALAAGMCGSLLSRRRVSRR